MPMHSSLTIHDLPQKHNCGFCGKSTSFIISLRSFPFGEAVADARLFPFLSLFLFSLCSVCGGLTICVFPVAVVPFSSVFTAVTSAASSTLTGAGASILSAISVTAAESSAIPVFTAKLPSSVSSAEAATFTIASAGPASVPETIATLCIFICGDLLALVTDL